MKKFILFFCALLMILISAGTLHTVASSLIGAPVATIAAAAFLIYAILPKANLKTPYVKAGVLTELWTGELVDKFRFIGKWLSVIPSEDGYVNNNVIHLADVGADPSVLIDNASFPIASSQRTDTDIPVALKKFDTTNTIITKDELYGLPYDKGASVIKQHNAVLEEVTAQHGLFSLAPSGDTANTPIIATTGADNGSSRKRLTLADIASAKKKLDDLKVPFAGRVLVLCNDHVNDLLLVDQSFRDRFINTKTGEPISFYGFDIYQDVFCPVYNGSTAKKAWGAAAAPSTDRNASTFFYAPRAFRAKGSVQMFWAAAENDPKNRQNEVGFSIYHIVLPKKNVGFGAIASAII